MKVALEQAAKCNDNVVLLGDEKNASTWDNYYNMDELPDERYQKFRKVYKNLSLNDEVFELRCFERYFYVLEYCKRMKLDRIILCDSDLLIYKNLRNILLERYVYFLILFRNQREWQYLLIAHFGR